MSPDNPLDIPEITHVIASYLESRDLTSCLLVSKSWKDSFLFYRWRVVKAGSEETSGPRFGPHPLDIYRHCHLIYNLSLYGDLCGLEKRQYPNLRRLTINCISSIQDQMALLNLVEMFPLLVNLSLECVKVAAASWLSISIHSHLRSLNLYRIHVDVPGFWRACTKLESLELGRVTIGRRSIPTDAVFDRMRKLWIWEIKEPDEAAQLGLILRCPKLEDLYWSVGDEDDDPLPRLTTHPIPRGHWPHLDRVVIEGNLQDTDLASILRAAGESCGSITRLELSSRIFGVQATQALRFQFSALVELNLENCFSPTSSSFRDILCFCPRLEVLTARSILAKDIAEAGPWGCQKLRQLKICFLFGKSEQDLQPLVFERLSTLTRLEWLTLYHPDGENESALEFRIPCGLAHLASLQQLTTLDFDTSSSYGRYIPQIGMVEVEWMTVHWEKLRRIRGYLNRDPLEDVKLKHALRLHGIGVS